MAQKGKDLAPEIIHLDWEGPWTAEYVSTPDRTLKHVVPEGYGIYQIYGTHSITGPDTLLYIGRANGRTFPQRIAEHSSKWLQWEPEPVRIHFGRIAAPDGLHPSPDRLGQMIDWAESLAIYFNGPAYNNASIRELRYCEPEIIVVNHGQRGRLPGCISNIPERLHPNGGGLTVVPSTLRPKRSPGAPKEDQVQ